MGEPWAIDAPAAEHNLSRRLRTATAIHSNFAEVGDIEDDAVALPAASKPLKSSASKRQETLEEESRRLKRIEAIFA